MEPKIKKQLHIFMYPDILGQNWILYEFELKKRWETIYLVYLLKCIDFQYFEWALVINTYVK